MAITISNLRFQPYAQKDAYKAVFGGVLDFTFILPDEHVSGDTYCIGLDFEKTVYPPSRPLCAYSTAFELEREEGRDLLSMSLEINTSRFRDWVSRLRKPTPITLQLCRIRGGRCITLLLDDILALPSIVDGVNTVCPGDPLEKLLADKLDKPYAAGEAGQVLSLDENGQTVWTDISGEIDERIDEKIESALVIHND